MLSYLRAYFCLMAVTAIPSGREDVAYPIMETLRSGVKILKLQAFQRDIQLRLENAGEIISDKFSYVNKANGETSRTIAIENVKRKLYRDKENGAALHINEDEYSLEINGIINHNLRIISDNNAKNIKDGRKAHRIIEISEDENYMYRGEQLIPDIEMFYDNGNSRNEEECQKVVIEYTFVTENNFTANFLDDEARTNYIAVTLLEVQNMMDSLELNITLALLGVISYTQENEPEFITSTAFSVGDNFYINSKTIMGRFSNYVSKSTEEVIKNSDIALFLSKRRFADLQSDGTANVNILGWAYVGTICHRHQKTGVVSDDKNIYERADVIAHESAHIMGSVHDGSEPRFPGHPGAIDCPAEESYIMGTYSYYNKHTYSPCTKANIEYLLNSTQSNCIKEECGVNVSN